MVLDIYFFPFLKSPSHEIILKAVPPSGAYEGQFFELGNMILVKLKLWELDSV